jgi:hypothetical protein
MEIAEMNPFSLFCRRTSATKAQQRAVSPFQFLPPTSAAHQRH